MRLVRIEIAKLYGNLSKRIDFKPRLNLLVGINGSGKTSILNCIDWLLKPDLPRLASTKFELIRIVLEKDGKELSIVAKQDATKVTIKEENGILSKHAITIGMVKSPESIANERDFINVFRHYSMLGPESSERELWKGLNALRAPLAITLDRTISADADDQTYFEDAERGRLQRSKTKSPLDKVLDVTQSAFAAYRDKVNRLNESLKLRIVSLAFSNPFEVQRGDIDQDVALDEITRLERKVTSFIGSMDAGSSVTKNISNYFSSAKKLASQARKEKSLRVLFFVQFRHLSELAKAFDDFEKKATNSFEPIGSYLRSINSFFKESRKQAGFNEKDGRFGFQFLNEAGAATGKFVSIDRLSSGEKQIIILLTFLTYVSSPDQVFIVDEPELSLHPKWQQSFLGAVLAQAPPGMQIILATHSPEIVAGRRQDCIVLEPR